MATKTTVGASVTLGRYPVTVSAARTDSSHPDIPSPLRLGAAARLTIRDEPVAAWELALQPGQDPTALGPEERYCFGVDSGYGSLFDAAAVDAVVPLNDRAIDHEKGDLTPEHKRFLDELRRNAWANLMVESTRQLNIVVFPCGFGDGCYAT